MMLRTYLIILLLCAASPLASDTSGMASHRVPSQVDVIEDARIAARNLAEAEDMLANATNAENRVRALTETVRAYENSLLILRDGLQHAAIREDALQNELNTREKDVQRLLATLMAIERSGGPSFFVHPAGALGTARSGMILADVTPELEKQSAGLRSALQDMRDLTTIQRETSEKLLIGLQRAELARTALSEAVVNRTDLPRRFIGDPVKIALLLAASETMAEFAGSLDIIARSVAPGSLPDIADRRGRLSLPIAGSEVTENSDRSAPPSLRLASPGKALVTTPVPATLRYHGPLLDYGNVVILEPQTGILIIMAGLDTVFGEIGQVLPGGSPVGWMPDANAPQETHADAHLSAPEASAGSQGSQTLYIEIRENNIPVDPLTWFAATEG